jgi:acetylornithine deacetylase/succinyl-diaminopimelate desuccinylase-like protein
VSSYNGCNSVGAILLRKLLGGCLVLISLAALSPAQTDATQLLARSLLEEMVNIKSTESGVGSTPVVQILEKHFREAGYGGADLFVGGKEPRKQNIVIRLRGRGEGKPVLMIAHLDVVEANREDWSPDIDPFKFVQRDGYFYGRGTQDVKEGAAILAANMIRWKQDGWKPANDLILALTADEEGGSANGVDWLLKNHRNLIEAQYCLNPDGGDFDERNGKPFLIKIAAGEKKYSAVKLETFNKGGHGSRPRKDNAIYQMAQALQKVQAFHFPVELSPVTREQLTRGAALESGQRAADMKAIVANPNDAAVNARMSEDQTLNALLHTTCVATEIQGGHAENALPQHVKAVLNCRILPDSDPATVLTALKNAVGDPEVKLDWESIDEKRYPSSPLNPTIMSAIETVAKQMYPGVTVMPSLELGASDGKYLRGEGIPTYGIPGTFIEENDIRSHGKDERLGVREFYDGVDFYNNLLKVLVK